MLTEIDFYKLKYKIWTHSTKIFFAKIITVVAVYFETYENKFYFSQKKMYIGVLLNHPHRMARNWLLQNKILWTIKLMSYLVSKNSVSALLKLWT